MLVLRTILRLDLIDVSDVESRWLEPTPLEGVTMTVEIRENESATAVPPKGLRRPRIEGHVSAGFEGVRTAFVENFTRRHELGGACCVYYRGEKVVDLWGGVRNKATGEPWEEDTMVLVWSATKGLAAMTLAVAHSRGWLDYDERVSTSWPEFAQNGKEPITVRQLLGHQAGLFALDEPIDASLLRDPDRLAGVLARQRPAWEPGTRQGYHAVTLGFYLLVVSVLAGLWRAAAHANGGSIAGSSAVALTWYIATSEAPTVAHNIRMIENIGNATVSLVSVTEITMLLYAPAEPVGGVPERRPVLPLNVAQLGLFWIE
jgi:hypothetical protein